MHEERYRIPPETVDAIAGADRVVAVGTTVVRALESWGATGRTEDATALFITPGFRWTTVDGLLTNFHVPRSSLLALVGAFVGERWRDLYDHALAQRVPVPVLRRRHAPGARHMRLTIDVEATDGAARVGRIRTPRGELPTPLFMPVGTRGAVKTLSSADLEALGVPLVLGNTYHLMLRPGAEVIERLGGLHGFMDWSGHVLTDSGGYQVFSLEPKVDDDGATFRSTYDGTTHRLTPEDAVRIQASLGADIQMALDVCPPLPAPDDVVRRAADRTHAWAERARAAFLAGAERRLDRGLDQAQFGICQGGADHRLRAESAKEIVSIGFDGYAIGGLSVGETRDITLPALAAAIEHLPADQPRYFMGLG